LRATRKAPPKVLSGPSGSKLVRNERTNAFGTLCRSKPETVRSLATALRAVSRVKRENRVNSLKSLKNRLMSAMSVDVAFAPLWVKDRETGKTVPNAVWEMAPAGAYYKAKRLCGLLTDIVLNYEDQKIFHLVWRMTTQVWQVSKRHFDGMLCAIRTRLGKKPLLWGFSFRKSPEAAKRFESLMANPSSHEERVYRYTRYRKGQTERSGCDACKLRRSRRVAWAISSLYLQHKCGKVHVARHDEDGSRHRAKAQ